ncbi:DUF1361 domain-containing protein [Leucobacter sp. PH1c]|uniref:DUF1361 domain-containing protein n=1 Tax=Leucobacter sp. PH1c TaxID=1397278 RepID=UPI00046A6E15|nr:DUF1361 domain-containing protein [Leucobacter sp. PH1c]
MFFLILGAVALNAYALLLVLLRAAVYRTRLYRPMLWNIWLSILPVLVLGVGGLVGLTLTVVSPISGFVVLGVTGLVWLLLLPNASYLITELNQSHRSEDDEVPLWYDIILVITLAMSGVVNTVLNVFIVHLGVALTLYGDRASALLSPLPLTAVGVVMLLLGFGMYLGRYPRFNSWDLRHPISFLRKFGEHFGKRENIAACAGFTLSYAVFLALIYLVVAGPVLEGLISVERIRTLLG